MLPDPCCNCRRTLGSYEVCGAPFWHLHAFDMNRAEASAPGEVGGEDISGLHTLLVAQGFLIRGTCRVIIISSQLVRDERREREEREKFVTFFV